MTLERDVGFQLTPVKPIYDPAAQKRAIEERIRAVEDWNNLLSEKAARLDLYTRMESNPKAMAKKMTNSSGSQLLLIFENDSVSEHS